MTHCGRRAPDSDTKHWLETEQKPLLVEQKKQKLLRETDVDLQKILQYLTNGSSVPPPFLCHNKGIHSYGK